MKSNNSKKTLAIIVSVFMSGTAMATTTSSSQLFFGDKAPDNSCGIEGRLATVDEIEYLKKHENLCRDVLSPHAIWKVDGNDGNIWQFMGYSY
ncbi:MAG: hypothetical protein ACRC8O_12640, partial [Plesiomonas shigelloides]